MWVDVPEGAGRCLEPGKKKERGELPKAGQGTGLLTSWEEWAFAGPNGIFLFLGAH